MHESSKNFNDRDKQRLECAAAATAATVEVTPSALRIPTGEPLNMFGPVAWTASFVEFLYGDATPGLQRDREVLYEEWCQCLLSREELQYSMPDDEEQYVASSPSRFVRPEILACVHDGRRRLGMLTGARTYLSRKGFAQDLKLLGRATVDDFIAAQRSVGDASASEAMKRLCECRAVPAQCGGCASQWLRLCSYSWRWIRRDLGQSQRWWQQLSCAGTAEKCAADPSQ